jgi:hypothetical protein
MTGSKLRVVGSGRHARRGEAERHEEAIRKADELLTLAESFEQEPEPDRPEGEDSGPQTSKEAEPAEPVVPDVDTVAAGPQVTKTHGTVMKPIEARTDAATKLYQETLHLMFDRMSDAHSAYNELEEWLKSNKGWFWDDAGTIHPHPKLTRHRSVNPAVRRKLEKQLDAIMALREEESAEPEVDIKTTWLELEDLNRAVLGISGGPVYDRTLRLITGLVTARQFYQDKPDQLLNKFLEDADDRAQVRAQAKRHMTMTPASRRKLEKQLDVVMAVRDEEVTEPDPNEVETAPDDRGGGLQDELPRFKAVLEAGQRRPPTAPEQD